MSSFTENSAALDRSLQTPEGPYSCLSMHNLLSDSQLQVIKVHLESPAIPSVVDMRS